MSHIKHRVLGVILAATGFLYVPASRAGTLYVAPDGSHESPFSTWATAATNIQSAIDAASAGDVVLVTNGIYSSGGVRASGGATTNRVALTKAITLRSVNGPEATIIEGHTTPGTTNGTQSFRCAWIGTGARLEGFTLRGGSTFVTTDTSGGGAFGQSATAIITNCIVTGNSAAAGGGGIYGGTAQGCSIRGNRAPSGGGTYATHVFDSEILENIGGGVYGLTASPCVISNCVITGNTMAIYGGGASYARLINCLIKDNAATQGGGTYNSFHTNCAIIGNKATSTGGGAYMGASSGAVHNCTVVQNTGAGAGGVFGGTVVNSIVYYNYSANGSPNYSNTKMTRCCSDPLPTGAMNIADAPGLLADAIHLGAASPCISRGTNVVAGFDTDGQAWNNPPSIGCDEWHTEPLLVSQPRVVPGSKPGEAIVSAAIAGASAWCQWTKDGSEVENDDHYAGAHSSSLVVRNFTPADGGTYQVVASNSFGMATSSVMTVNIACVDAGNANPIPPYTNWATAAQSIQDAIDAVDAGAVILVTNGIYATGGKSMSGDTPSRIAVDKAITLLGVNGAEQTIIEGAWDPATTNGTASVRCAWLEEGAMIGGFTLRNGSCTNNGGGIWSAQLEVEANVMGCTITNCRAAVNGGGAFRGQLKDCVLSGNAAANGGGAMLAILDGCSLAMNAASYGGGANQGRLEDCEVVGNTSANGAGVYRAFVKRTLIATNSGFGILEGTAVNCRLIANTGSGAGSSAVLGCLLRGNTPYGSSNSTNLNCTFTENATTVLNGRSTNCLFSFNRSTSEGAFQSYCVFQSASTIADMKTSVAAFPNLLGDGMHIAGDSPCLGRGTNTGLVECDIDGQPFGNPPAIGCDEWNPQPLLVSQPRLMPGTLPGEAVLFLELAGAPTWCVWTKDGVAIEDGEHYAAVHSSALILRNFNTSDAGAYQVIATNSFGAVTSSVVTVKVACVDAVSINPAAPYATWAAAAQSIQDAVDAVDADTVVLVTNGIYAVGSRTVAGDSASRVVVDKPITLLSVNGPEQTVIEGAWDPASTNGAASVRCAYLGEGAVLGGFTLRNGSTPGSGGGVSSAGLGLHESAIGCVITNCRAATNGGGAYQGRLRECVIAGNASAGNGGGAASSVIERSLVAGNTAVQGGGVYAGVSRGCRILNNEASNWGGGGAGLSQLLISCAMALNEASWYGGVYGGTLYNCTIVSNTAWGSRVAGLDFCTVNNSIIYFNHGLYDPVYGNQFENIGGCSTYQSICCPYAPNSTGKIVLKSNPQLTDLWHLSATSPCRGFATNLGNVGFPDIDGESWSSQASIGCDEFVSSNITGALSVAIQAWPLVAAGGVMPLTAHIEGRASDVHWDFGDGTQVENAGFNPTRTWTNPGPYVVTATAFNADHAAGVSATAAVQVIPVEAPELGVSAKSATSFVTEFSGQPGLTYEVQVSTDLVPPISWQVLQTLISTGGPMTIADSYATNQTRFYRLNVR